MCARTRRPRPILAQVPAQSPGAGVARTMKPRMRKSWRWRWDSNPRYPCGHTRFRGALLKPLGHSTAGGESRTAVRGARAGPCPSGADGMNQGVGRVNHGVNATRPGGCLAGARASQGCDGREDVRCRWLPAGSGGTQSPGFSPLGGWARRSSCGPPMAMYSARVSICHWPMEYSVLVGMPGGVLPAANSGSQPQLRRGGS